MKIYHYQAFNAETYHHFYSSKPLNYVRNYFAKSGIFVILVSEIFSR